MSTENKETVKVYQRKASILKIFIPKAVMQIINGWYMCWKKVKNYFKKEEILFFSLFTFLINFMHMLGAF